MDTFKEIPRTHNYEDFTYNFNCKDGCKNKERNVDFVHKIIGFLKMLEDSKNVNYALNELETNIRKTKCDLSDLFIREKYIELLMNTLYNNESSEQAATIFQIFIYLSLKSEKFLEFFMLNIDTIYKSFVKFPSSQAIMLFCNLMINDLKMINYFQSKDIIDIMYYLLGNNPSHDIIVSLSDFYYIITVNGYLLSSFHENDVSSIYNKCCDISHFFFEKNEEKMITTSLLMLKELCTSSILNFNQLFTDKIIVDLYNMIMKRKYLPEIIGILISICKFYPQFIDAFLSADSPLFSSLNRFSLSSIHDGLIILPLLISLTNISDDLANTIIHYDFLSSLYSNLDNLSYLQKKLFVNLICSLINKIDKKMIYCIEMEKYLNIIFEFLDYNEEDNFVILILKTLQILLDNSLCFGNVITQEELIDKLEELNYHIKKLEIQERIQYLLNLWT